MSRQDACSRRGSSAGGPWPIPAPCSPRGGRTHTHEAPAAPIAPLGPHRHALTRGREAPRQGVGQLARADEAHAHGPGLGARGGRRNRPTRAGDAVTRRRRADSSAGGASGAGSSRFRPDPAASAPIPPPSARTHVATPRSAPAANPRPGARGGPIRGRIAAVRPPPL